MSNDNPIPIQKSLANKIAEMPQDAQDRIAARADELIQQASKKVGWRKLKPKKN